MTRREQDDSEEWKAVATLPEPGFRRRIKEAQELLAQLSDFEFHSALLAEIDRRRTDSDDNRRDEPPGIYMASVVALAALFGRGRPEDQRMAADLAAVARGTRVRAPGDDSVVFREISEITELLLATDRIPKPEKALSLSKTLEKWFGRPVSQAAVEAAMSRKTVTGRAVDLAFAAHAIAGSVGDETARRAALKRAREALKETESSLKLD